MPTRTVNWSDEAYSYVLDTVDEDEESFSERANELIEKGIQAEQEPKDE